MPTFHAWQVTPSDHSLATTMRLTEGESPELRIVDDEALEEAVEDALAAAESAPSEPRYLPPELVLRLESNSEALTVDYADIGYRLVSRRLREVLALGDAEAQYLPVDTRGCPAAVQAKEYRWLHLPHLADPFDHERSDGELVYVFPGLTSAWAPDAPLKQRLRLRLPAPGYAPRIAWRADFIPPAPLFQTLGLPWTLAATDLVQRRGMAGVADLVFRNLSLR